METSATPLVGVVGLSIGLLGALVAIAAQRKKARPLVFGYLALLIAAGAGMAGLGVAGAVRGMSPAVALPLLAGGLVTIAVFAWVWPRVRHYYDG
jgi:drug/metabolite transporter (DMT)-like permease